MFRPSTFDYLQMRAAQGAQKTFGYMFSLEMPPYGGILPWHNAEIPYVFHTADSIEPSSIGQLTDDIGDRMPLLVQLRADRRPRLDYVYTDRSPHHVL